MKELKGKTAFVTGGSSGIGRGIVKVLAAEGMKVAFSYQRQDHLDQAMAYFRDKPGQAVHPIKVDVTDRPGLAAAKAEIERVYGPVQVLINNAGVGIHGLMEQATFSDWDWVMSVNVGGVVNSLVTFLPGMISSGREAHIVNVASMGGIAALGSVGLYTTTKYAVVGLSESLRTDMIGRNVGVSVYCPGTVKSNIGGAAKCGMSASKIQGTRRGNRPGREKPRSWTWRWRRWKPEATCSGASRKINSSSSVTPSTAMSCARAMPRSKRRSPVNRWTTCAPNRCGLSCRMRYTARMPDAAIWLAGDT